MASDLEPEPDFYAMKYLPPSENIRQLHDFDGIRFRETTSLGASAQIPSILHPRQITTSDVQHSTQLVALPAGRSTTDTSSTGSAIHQSGAATNFLIESIVRKMMFASGPQPPPEMAATTLPLPNLLGSTIHPFRLAETRPDNADTLATLLHPNIRHYQNPLLQVFPERAEPKTRPQSQVTATVDLLNMLAETLHAPKNDSDTPISNSLSR